MNIKKCLLCIAINMMIVKSAIANITNPEYKFTDNAIDKNINPNQEYLTHNPQESFTHTSRHSFSIGTEIFSYSYKEPGLMKTKGNFYGINAAYSYCFDDGLCVQPELSFNKGKENYSSNGTGSVKGIRGRIFEARTLLKKLIPLSESEMALHPFIGIGYRYKRDDSFNMITNSGFGGYLRKSNYYYIPLGLNVDFSLTREWSVSVLGEYDFLLKGIQQTYSKIDYVKHRQNQGYGLRSEVLLNRSFNKHVLSIGPFINYWNIKQSNAAANILNSSGAIRSYSVEPKNTTTELGIKIKYGF